MMIKRFSLFSQDIKYAQEFLKNPFGPYSLGLQKILLMLRGSSLRLGILCIKPFEHWILIEFQGPKKPIILFKDIKFTNLKDAEIEIFRRRWIDCTGVDPFK